jgi:hypothetical protein
VLSSSLLAFSALEATPTGAHQLASAWAMPGCRVRSSWEVSSAVIEAK